MDLKTRTHRCLANGSTGYGGWCNLNSPLAVEMMGHGLELDFLTVDMQHAAIGVGDAIHLIRALQSASPDVTPFVRLPTQDRYWIEQSLDAGYVGLIVPMVESASQAHALVQAANYPPDGVRSRAGTIRASIYQNYFEQINQHVILLPQVETAEGLTNCQAIVEVPGVTGVVLGPGDLSLSCGWHVQDIWAHNPFLDAVDRVVSACKSSGKIAATLVSGLTDAMRARDAGFHLVAFASDGVDLRVEMLPRTRKDLQQLRKPS
ncbi:MAG: hypothetical protein IT445_13395 [Phycisphaeraceae bacterium]|nr:hypothetical protein [Phycisphaeraceae bacterium]